MSRIAEERMWRVRAANKASYRFSSRLVWRVRERLLGAAPAGGSSIVMALATVAQEAMNAPRTPTLQRRLRAQPAGA
jgi:hypothetical protein